MFTKIELLGITTSICAMILALYLVTHESSVLSFADRQSQPASAQQGLVVIDSTDANSESTLRDALTNSVSNGGQLQTVVATDVRFGVGDGVQKGDTVVVHYVGTLQDGYEFDNSNKRGEPYTFTVGDGRVIKGWEEGIIGMKVGGTRILVVPPALGYGSEGFGPVPPNAPLVFSMELLEIK